MKIELGASQVPFRTVVLDPPWKYGDSLSTKVLRGASRHYKVMSLGEIAAIPVSRITAADAHIYLWVTNAFVEQGHILLRSWGISYKTTLTWVKTSKHGRRYFGMGRYFRNNTEHVLFGVRGKLPTLRKNQPTAFEAPIGAHSEKPDLFYDIAESMSPGPRLELFARKVRPSWTVWGDEIHGVNQK